MTDLSKRHSAGWIRWIPRILGIPIGLFAFGEFITALGYLEELIQEAM